MGHGTRKIFFTRRDGVVAPLSIDKDLADTFDKAKNRNNHNWDYVAIVAGLPGVGKSTFVMNTCAPYVCPWFSEKYICFSDNQFIEVTSKCREYSAVVLDESFAPMNSKIMFSPEFLRIVNHLQIIRKKRLFIFLCLPNFFDLAKTISIFRSSHLFVPYEDNNGRRGSFSAFGRYEKRLLFIKGSKFLDYTATDPNFHGRFYRNSLVLDEERYEEMKSKHILLQDAKIGSSRLEKHDRNIILYALNRKLGVAQTDLAKIFEMRPESISKIVLKVEKDPILVQKVQHLLDQPTRHEKKRDKSS